MDDSESPWSQHAGESQDRLLSRAVSGDGDALTEIRARAASQPGLLDELALWQADELRLIRAGRALDACADRVNAPLGRSGGAVRDRLGWAVAAALAALLFGRIILPQDGSPAPAAAPASVAGFSGFATSDDAFDAYVAKAREDGVMIGDPAPPTLVGTRELGDGRGFEVVIIRQVMERRVSPQLYRVAPTDETGRLRPVVIRPRTELVQ